MPYGQRFDAVSLRLHSLYRLSPEVVSEFCGLIDVAGPPHADQDILRDQRRGNDAYILLEGLACHYRLVHTARRQLTGFILPGDLCCYGFLSSSQTRQSVGSLGHVVLGRIDLADLAALGNRHPDIILALMRAAFIDSAQTRELAVSLGARDATGRMAHFLCEMHERLSVVGLVDENHEFPLAMTQAELGEALGLSSVHVNRTIQHLRRTNVITMAQGRVRLNDLEALKDSAAFDGHYLTAG